MNSVNIKLVAAITMIALAFVTGMYVALRMHGQRPPVEIPGLLWPDPIQLSEFSVDTADGKLFTRANLRDHWTLLFFGFTNCPDICPSTMKTLAEVYTKYPGGDQDVHKLQVLFVSVDPERDSTELLRDYTAYFNPEFIAATADEARLSKLTQQIGVLFMKIDEPGSDTYSMDHTASVFLVDPDARIVGLFSPPHSANELSAHLPRIVSFIDPS